MKPVFSKPQVPGQSSPPALLPPALPLALPPAIELVGVTGGYGPPPNNLRTHQLQKARPHKERPHKALPHKAPQAVIREVSLTVQAGEWLSLVGANGSGKSTLLKLIGQLLRPWAGELKVQGHALAGQSRRAIAQTVAFLPQQQVIPATLTVEQLVGLGRSPHQPWWQWDLTTADWAHIDQAIATTQLEGDRQRLVASLSGGERQRAFLALALAQDPQILLLDEPTTYLDLRYQLELLNLLQSWQQQSGRTVITVLHDLNLASRYSDRLALLQGGKLLVVGPPAAVLTPHWVAQGFGVQAAMVETPVGPQICPLAPCPSRPETQSSGTQS